MWKVKNVEITAFELVQYFSWIFRKKIGFPKKSFTSGGTTNL